MGKNKSILYISFPQFILDVTNQLINKTLFENAAFYFKVAKYKKPLPDDYKKFLM